MTVAPRGLGVGRLCLSGLRSKLPNRKAAFRRETGPIERPQPAAGQNEFWQLLLYQTRIGVFVSTVSMRAHRTENDVVQLEDVILFRVAGYKQLKRRCRKAMIAHGDPVHHSAQAFK